MSNVDQNDDEVGKRQVAKHSLLDAGGNIVEDIKLATGLRYQDILSGEIFDWQSTMPAGKGQTMLCLFGGRTLATNEASAVRQAAKAGKGTGDGAEQMSAIKDRFALIDGGEWVDKTREGGVRIDKPLLATAMVNVMTAAKLISTDEEKAQWVERLLKGFEEGNPAKKQTAAQYIANVRAAEGVAAEYAKLAGKTGKKLDEMVALLG